MDWKALPAFLAVARSGSLRAAAEQMGGTHATLRRQIEADSCNGEAPIRVDGCVQPP